MGGVVTIYCWRSGKKAAYLLAIEWESSRVGVMTSIVFKIRYPIRC